MVFAISWHLPYTLQLGSVRKVIVFFFSPLPQGRPFRRRAAIIVPSERFSTLY